MVLFILNYPIVTSPQLRILANKPVFFTGGRQISFEFCFAVVELTERVSGTNWRSFMSMGGEGAGAQMMQHACVNINIDESVSRICGDYSLP